MFCNLLSSNFIYHQSKTINLPKNIPKIKNVPFKSISNVKFHNNPQFLTNLSSYAPSRSMDTNLQLKKLRKQIPNILFSKILQPTSPLHNNFLVKPNSLSLIVQQELAIPDVYCPGCTKRSSSCLDCRYLASETSPTDQANLNVLRNAIKVLDDPNDSSKHVIEVDYQFSI